MALDLSNSSTAVLILSWQSHTDMAENTKNTHTRNTVVDKVCKTSRKTTKAGNYSLIVEDIYVHVG
jgi:hypothetical protein